MALVRYTETSIVIDIPDYVYGSTIIKRKAEVLNLTYSPQESRVVINLAIYPFQCLPDGSYGEAMNQHPMLKIQYTKLVADNTAFVNTATGEIIANGVDGWSQEQIDNFIAEQEELEISVMYEWEFYSYMAENVRIILNEPIVNKVNTAAAEGRFDLF